MFHGNILTFSFKAFHLSFIFSRSFSKTCVLTPCRADLTRPCPILLQWATFWPSGSRVRRFSSVKSFCWARICSTSEDTGLRLRTCSEAYGAKWNKLVRFKECSLKTSHNLGTEKIKSWYNILLFSFLTLFWEQVWVSSMSTRSRRQEYSSLRLMKISVRANANVERGYRESSRCEIKFTLGPQ